LTLTIIDNENYSEEINDLYPIEIYVSSKISQKKIWNKTLKENSKTNKAIGKLNYNRLKEIKLKELKNKTTKKEDRYIKIQKENNEIELRRSKNCL